MKKFFVRRAASALLAGLALCVFSTQCLAADAQPAKDRQAGVAQGANAVAKTKPAQRQPVLVDINSASRDELKKLPGIGNAEADRIIAGRPYLSKAHLQTRNIVSPGAYQGLRELVVARQKDAKFGKAAGK